MEPWQLGRRAELSDASVAYDVFGDGPPIVLVHGTPSSSYLWRNVVPRLAPSFRVHVFDLAGYGDSGAGPHADLSIAGHTRRLVELLDRWGLSEPAVAGHDIGSSVVLRAHLLQGRRFRRMALIDAVAFAPWITPTTRHMREHLEAYRTMPAHVFDEIVATHVRTAVFRPLPDEILSAYLRPWRGESGRDAYLRKIEQFVEADTVEFEPLLPTIDVPVRIIWGERDAWLDPEVARRLAAAVPGADLLLVPDAGHFAMEDAPEAVGDALFEFFADGA